MDYEVFSLDGAQKVPMDLDGRILFTSDRFELVHLTLGPGEGMDLHSMPFEVIFYVYDGRGALSFGKEQAEASAGTCIRVNPGVMRGWRNTGTSSLRLVVMKLK